MPIPIEDTFSDIIGKAMRGLSIPEAQLATSAIVEPAAVKGLREGQWDEAVARRIAPVLGLNADALVALGNQTYQPAPIALDGLAQFNTPYEDMTVNSYLVWDPASREAVAFDTGADCSEMLTEIAKRELKLALILITHTHGDHIFDFDRLCEKTGVPAFTGNREKLEGAEPFAPGKKFSVGPLQIETRLTWGHSEGGITYVVRGLAQPVAIVGDAVFAGSMGGGGVSYEAALTTNRAEIYSLPDETIICSGHGPLTTVGEQRRHNPFFA